MKTVKELYDYREMIFSLVRRELRGKYKGSILGFLWAFLNPLLQLCVYTFVFTFVSRNDGIDDFYMFLFVALIPWIYISSCMTGGTTSVTSQTEMVKKIYFPRIILPISYATSQFINMLLSFIIVFAALIFSGIGISWIAFIYLPVILLLEYILGVAITILFSCINVYLRDLQQVSGVLAMALQFLSPILYSIDLVPLKYKTLYMLNPIAPMTIIYRDILYYQRIPDLLMNIQLLIFSVLLLVLSCMLFSKLKRRFAEEL